MSKRYRLNFKWSIAYSFQPECHFHSRLLNPMGCRLKFGARNVLSPIETNKLIALLSYPWEFRAQDQGLISFPFEKKNSPLQHFKCSLDACVHYIRQTHVAIGSAVHFIRAFRINSIAIRLIDEIERKRSMHKTWTITLVAIPSVVCFKTLIYGTLNQLSFLFFHAIRVCLFSFSC